MPNRILREGILTSRRVNLLSEKEETFYRRLMSIVDDYGRCEAHASLLRASLYPLRVDKMREETIEGLLAACEKAALLKLYFVAGKRYLELSDFRQQMRSKSKYPAATDIACIADAMHPLADAHLVGVVSGGEGVVVSEGVVGARRAPDRPKALEEVIAYFVEKNSTEDQANRFFDQFEAVGWIDRDGAMIRSWRAAARKWIRNGKTFERKNLGSPVPPKQAEPPFDPALPNAHTGGVPLAN